LAEAGVNHDDAGYFETLIMMYITDYKLQPLDLKEAKEVIDLATATIDESKHPGETGWATRAFKLAHRFIEAVNG
jgi:hypothetical protein